MCKCGNLIEKKNWNQRLSAEMKRSYESCCAYFKKEIIHTRRDSSREKCIIWALRTYLMLHRFHRCIFIFRDWYRQCMQWCLRAVVNHLMLMDGICYGFLNTRMDKTVVEWRCLTVFYIRPRNRKWSVWIKYIMCTRTRWHLFGVQIVSHTSIGVCCARPASYYISSAPAHQPRLATSLCETHIFSSSTFFCVWLHDGICRIPNECKK